MVEGLTRPSSASLITTQHSSPEIKPPPWHKKTHTTTWAVVVRLADSLRHAGLHAEAVDYLQQAQAVFLASDHSGHHNRGNCCKMATVMGAQLTPSLAQKAWCDKG